jgi:hypothetical protein
MADTLESKHIFAKERSNTSEIKRPADEQNVEEGGLSRPLLKTKILAQVFWKHVNVGVPVDVDESVQFVPPAPAGGGV